MNERLQRIADDLGTNVYKDALHGQIARDNFIYGVKQAEMESEAFYTAEMLRKEREEADLLREVKQMVVDRACKCFELAEDWQAWANGDFEYAKSYFRKVLEEDEK